MRLALVLLALAAPASAQSQFSGDAGLYVAVTDADLLRGGDDERAGAGAVGWRFGNGLDAGLSARVEGGVTAVPFRGANRDDRRAFALGVEAGYTTGVTGRSGLRLGVAGRLGRAFFDGTPTPSDAGRDVVRTVNEGRVEASLAAFRSVSVQSVTVQPTLRVATGATFLAATGPDRPFTLRADAERGVSTDGGYRLAAALPVTARVLGAGVTLDPEVGYVSGGRTSGQGYAAVVVRLNV